MPEYIERDKLVSKFLDKQFSGTSSKIDIAETIRFVNSMPTADVVEVVRCIQCRNLESVKTSRGSALRCRRNMVTEPYIHLDCYCCYGENR